jgi:polyisoprenoid-binding protein YceI
LAVKYLALLAVLVLACSKKEEPPRRTAPWRAQPSASARTTSEAGPLRFRVLPESSFRFSVPTRRSRPAGTIALQGGTIDLDPRDLSRTKATLDFDLTRLSVDSDSLPQGAELDGAEPRALALQWLELGAGVPAERREQFSKAHFELSAVEDASGPFDLEASKSTARTTATAVGSLLLHGFRAPVRTRVQLQAQKPTGPEAARRVTIRSLDPVVLSLPAHDILARSASGVNDAALTARLADVIGKSARVEFELIAESAPPNVK